ncbi:Nn.00g041960.m01.CDS01 [Neocucurbitaria sp. VM-36]
MKRKFSFNLAPVKLSAKPDTTDKQAPEPTPSHSQASSQSHRRHTSKDSISDYSAYINRRILDPDTEQELRIACRLILQNFKPSDHGMENTDPKLDFGAMQRRKEPREHREHKSQPAEVAVRMPTGAPVEMTSSFVARKPSTRTKTRTRDKADMEIRARTQGDLPARANSSRKRADFGWLDDRDDKREQNLRKLGKSPSIDLPRSTALHVDADSGVSTPVTVASTLAYSKQPSTAPTSASLPSGRSSNRRSRQLDNPAAVADAQAAEWMRQELEKRRKEEASEPQARPSTAVRPPSRTASIRNNIKEYVFPGTRSRNLSRAQSTESLRTTDSQDPSDPQRTGSAVGWRSWGLPRRSGSRSNSRPGTSRGQSEEPEENKKSEPKAVNLNRDLPPLPSLDTWKEPEPPKEEVAKSPKSPTSAAHIASLMRPQEQTQERSPALGREHRRSRSDTLAVQYANAYPVRTSSHNKDSLQAPPQPTRVAPVPESAIDRTTTGRASTSNLNTGLDPGSSTHTRERSGDSLTSPTSPHGQSSLEVPLSFSRTISMDAPSHSTTSHENKSSRREEQKSRLKKVFTGWMHKKEKKDDWMHRIEKEGVKEGVIVQDSTQVAPVVRY